MVSCFINQIVKFNNYIKMRKLQKIEKNDYRNGR